MLTIRLFHRFCFPGCCAVLLYSQLPLANGLSFVPQLLMVKIVSDEQVIGRCGSPELRPNHSLLRQELYQTPRLQDRKQRISVATGVHSRMSTATRQESVTAQHSTGHSLSSSLCLCGVAGLGHSHTVNTLAGRQHEVVPCASAACILMESVSHVVLRIKFLQQLPPQLPRRVVQAGFARRRRACCTCSQRRWGHEQDTNPSVAACARTNITQVSYTISPHYP